MEQSLEEIRSEYRRMLLDIEHKSIDSFDKAVMTLSGGALGLSMTFLHNIIGPSQAVHVNLLLTAWGLWAASLSFTLWSFWLSARAMRRAVHQLDNRTIGRERLGGFWDWATGKSTVLGGASFIFGIATMIVFVHFNL